jgi:hypothetical protein
MALSTDDFDLLENHVAMTAEPRRSIAFIDRLIGTKTDKIGIVSDDSDEFDIYRDLDALPRAFQWKADHRKRQE